MSTDLWVLGLGAGVLAAMLTIALDPLVIRIAHRLGALDPPSRRKAHDHPVPRIGGIAIFLGAGLPLAACVLLPGLGIARNIPTVELVAFIATTGLVFLLGLADDLRGVGTWHKLLVQTLAATVMVWLGWQFSSIDLPFLGHLELGVFGPLLSLVWIVGITNAINLMDGLDGLAAGLAAIVLVSVAALAMGAGEAGTAVACSAFAGACLGFLRDNWSPARIFMGDSGSLTLGFILACLTLHASIKATAAVAVFVPVLALGLPAMDVVLVMLVRFVGRPKAELTKRIARVFIADRQHLHYLMTAWAKRRRTVVLWLYLTTALFCLLAAIAVVTAEPGVAVLLVALEFGAVLAIRTFGAHARARQIVDEKKAEARKTGFAAAAPTARGAAQPSGLAQGEEARFLDRGHR